MSQLDKDIKRLEDKKKAEGLTLAEKIELEELYSKWECQEAAQYGGHCPHCFF